MKSNIVANNNDDDDYFGPYKISDLTSLETLRGIVEFIKQQNADFMTEIAENACDRIMELKQRPIDSKTLKEINEYKMQICALAGFIYMTTDPNWRSKFDKIEKTWLGLHASNKTEQ